MGTSIRKAKQERRIGIAHKRLRGSGRQKVGDGKRSSVEQRSGDGFAERHPERQTVVNFERQHHAVAEPVELAEQVDNLRLEHEVPFGPGWGSVGSELDLADDARRRGEDRLASSNLEAFDAAVGEGLHEGNKASTGG